MRISIKVLPVCQIVNNIIRTVISSIQTELNICQIGNTITRSQFNIFQILNNNIRIVTRIILVELIRLELYIEV